MSAIRTQTFKVTLADETELLAEAGNPDQIRWELTAAKHRWPTVEVDSNGQVKIAAPVLYTTFLAWAALTRAGTYTGTWDEFQKVAMAVDQVSDEPVDPTQPEPDSGY